MVREILAWGRILALIAASRFLPAQQSWGPGDSDVILSEIHYHPCDDEEKGEFLELHNAGVRWVDVSGWTFKRGIEFTFPDGTVIAPAGFLVVARNVAALKASRKIDNLVGDFKGNLSNTGEIIELWGRSGRILGTISYGDGSDGSWPDRADGEGPSLELLEPHPDWHRAWHWGSSRVPGGTPGRASSRGGWSPAGDALAAGVAASKLRINEVRLAESSLFVEILNEGAETQPLDGLKLSSDPLGEGGVPLSGSVAKKKLHVFEGEAARPLASRQGSRRLFLLKADTQAIIDSFPLRKDVPAEGSVGRFPDGANDVFTFQKPTQGTPNPRPAPSDLVISEILYHGREDAQKKTEEELIEIHNRGKGPVDLKGWRIDRAAEFAFPDGAVIPPAAFAVVSNDPEKLRARLTPDEGKLVFGPMKGKLSNSGDSIALVNPWGDVMDRVRYSDRPPWPSGADGGGFSLELLHPDLDNRWPQAWTLGPSGGTPCRKNAREVKAMAPAVAGVRHEPAVPGPEDEVIIHAHVLDTGALSEVAVIFRDLAGVSKSSKKTMTDSGQVDDGAAKDGHYAARLPRLRAGTLVGFYIQVRDASGKVVRTPEGDREFHFQVESPGPSNGPPMPVYRILMARESWDRFMRTNSMQDTMFPCTFIAGMEGRGANVRDGQVFYGAAIRYRGHGSRMPQDRRFSYRLELARGDLFDGRDRLCLNADSAHRQKDGSDILRLSGVLASNVSMIRLKSPGLDDNRYADVEVVNNEFLDRRYGTSAGGIYRAKTDERRRGDADLGYRGPAPEPYLAAYEQVNKKGTANIQALVKALEALDTKDDALYVQKVEEAIDAAEWAAYFAVNHVLMNNETTLCNGVPDDYFIAQRPTDGKFILVAWDQDSFFTEKRGYRWGNEPIFGRGVPAVRRFLQHSGFAPLYHRAIRNLLDGPLSKTSLSWRLSFLTGMYSGEELSRLEDFAAWRQASLGDRYVLWPQATVQFEGQAAPSSGFGTRIFLGADAGPEVTLSGFADPAVAFKVKAGGSLAAYDAVTGRWNVRREASSLVAGSNPLWIELLGAKDDVQSLYSINLERGPPAHAAPAELDGKVEWKSGNGPYLLQGSVVVAAGATLRIGPGVDVICAPGAMLTVRGTLLVEGTAVEPVTFRPADGDRSWSGIRFVRTGSGTSGPRHTLTCCRFEGGRAILLAEGESPSTLDSCFISAQGTSVSFDRCLFRGIQGTAMGSEGAAVEMRGVRVVDGRAGMFLHGGSVRFEGVEIARLQGDGLRLSSIEKDGSAVKGCAFRDVRGTALSVDRSKVSLESCLVLGSSTGLAISGGSRVRAAHMTLAANGTGVALDRRRAVRRSTGSAAVQGGGGGRSGLELADSILAVELEHVESAPGSLITLSRCLAAPGRALGDAVKAEGLTRGLPRFVAPHRGDFRLEKGSPGQGAGSNGTDLGFAGMEPR